MTFWCSYHGQHIIAICQLKDNTVRVTFRDCVGKYTWDAKLQYEQTKIMTKAIDQRRQVRTRYPYFIYSSLGWVSF